MTSPATEPLLKDPRIVTPAAAEPLFDEPDFFDAEDALQHTDALPSASEALTTMQCCLTNVKVCCKKKSIRNDTLWQREGKVWKGTKQKKDDLTAAEKEMWMQESLDNFEQMCSRVKLSGMAFMCEDAKLRMEQLCDMITSFKSEFDKFEDPQIRLRFDNSTKQLLGSIDRDFVDGMRRVSPSKTKVVGHSWDHAVWRAKKNDHAYYSHALASLDNLFGSSAIVHYESNRLEDYVLNFHCMAYLAFCLILLIMTVCVCSYILFQFLFLLIVHMSPGAQKLDPVDEEWTEGRSAHWIAAWQRLRMLEPMLGFLCLPILIVALSLLGCENYYVINSCTSTPHMARIRAYLMALRLESKKDTWKSVEEHAFWSCFRSCLYEVDHWFVFWFDVHIYGFTVLLAGFFFLNNPSVSMSQGFIIAALCAIYPGALLCWQEDKFWNHLVKPKRSFKAVRKTKIKFFQKEYEGADLVWAFVMWCVLCFCCVMQPEEAYAGFLMGGVLWALATTCTFMLADIVTGKRQTKGFATLLTGVLQDRMVQPGHMYSSFPDIKRRLKQQMRLRAYQYSKTETLSGCQLVCRALSADTDNPGGRYLYVSRILLSVVLWTLTCIFSSLHQEAIFWRLFSWTCMVVIMFFMALNAVRESYFPEMGLIDFYKHVMWKAWGSFCKGGVPGEEDEEDEEEHDNHVRLCLVILVYVVFVLIYIAPTVLICHFSKSHWREHEFEEELIEGAIVLGSLMMTLWAIHCYLTDLMPNLSFEQSNHVDPLSGGGAGQKDTQFEYIERATMGQRLRLAKASQRSGSGSTGKFRTRKGYEQASFNAYCMFMVFYTGLCMLFLFLSRIDVERFGAHFTGEGVPYYEELDTLDSTYAGTPYSDGWKGAPNKYPVCDMTWGAESLDLRVLDLAALAQFAYSSNKAVLKTALENTFSTNRWSSRIHSHNLEEVAAEIDEFEDIPRRLKVKFVSTNYMLDRKEYEKNQTTYVIAVKGSSNSLEFSADASIYSGVAVLQFFSQFVDLFDLLPNLFLARILKYVRVPRVRNLEQVIIDKVVGMVEAVKKADPQAEVVITGHSLGGGIAAAAGSITGTTTLVFSSPGYHFNRYVMGTTILDAFRSVVNIWPESDVVPLVDRHDETVQRIACRAKGSGSRGAGSCHLIATTFCELWRVCGDYQKRNVTDYCKDNLGSLPEINSVRGMMINMYGEAKPPAAEPRGTTMEFLWNGWWYLFALAFFGLCIQAPLRVGLGAQCDLMWRIWKWMRSCCGCRQQVSKELTST